MLSFGGTPKSRTTMLLQTVGQHPYPLNIIFLVGFHQVNRICTNKAKSGNDLFNR